MARYCLILLCLLLGACDNGWRLSAPATCTYNSYQWNVNLKRAVNHRRIEHPYSTLSPEEIDPQTGCSLCEEDQVTLDISGLGNIRVCYKIAAKVEKALEQLVEQGVPLQSVEAYRVGRTRGPVDADGNRTRFSNHAYGSAIDINEDHNGLYDRCLSFNGGCRLIKGGPWRPGYSDYSLHPGGATVGVFKQMGFKWGGEIEGRQKDFMHFSLTGY